MADQVTCRRLQFSDSSGLSKSATLAPLSCPMCIVNITRLMPGVHQPDPPGLIHDDPRLLPPWRGSSLIYGKIIPFTFSKLSIHPQPR
jgi:hypothetical protein